MAPRQPRHHLFIWANTIGRLLSYPYLYLYLGCGDVNKSSECSPIVLDRDSHIRNRGPSKPLWFIAARDHNPMGAHTDSKARAYLQRTILRPLMNCVARDLRDEEVSARRRSSGTLRTMQNHGHSRNLMNCRLISSSAQQRPRVENPTNVHSSRREIRTK
jgi:hypothetical protein